MTSLKLHIVISSTVVFKSELYYNTIRKEGEEMKTGAVIAAAGMSSRMGDFKPLMKMGTISIVKRVIANFQQAEIFPIVLVTGYRAAELEKHVSKLGVVCIRNKRYESTEMSDSIRIGLSYIKDKCDKTFFSPVDIPLFTSETLKKLMQSDAAVIKPVYKNKAGHPVLISCELIPRLLEDKTGGGMSGALRNHISVTEKIDVDDPGIIMDADTPEDYEELVEYHSRQLFRPNIEISFIRENKIFDSSLALLLHMVEYDGTVKSACEKMGISYSKAWNMLSDFEANLGFELIDRCAGGEAGGASRLTEKGKKILYQYEDYCQRVRHFAEECFNERIRGNI